MPSVFNLFNDRLLPRPILSRQRIFQYLVDLFGYVLAQPAVSGCFLRIP